MRQKGRLVKKPHVWFAIVISLLATTAAPTPALDRDKGLESARWKIDVQTIKASPSISLYISPDDKGIPGRGSVLALAGVLPGASGEISAVVIVKGDDGQSYTFVKGDIKAGKDAIFVVAKCRVLNKGESNHSFRIGDLVMSDDAGKRRSLVAVGLGGVLFDKISPVESEAASQKSIEIVLRGEQLVTYVWSLPKTSRSWRLALEGGSSLEVESTAKP